MNDFVEVTGHDRQTPLIRFVQKGKGVVSFTGEKLYEAQVYAVGSFRIRQYFLAWTRPRCRSSRPLTLGG